MNTITTTRDYIVVEILGI